MLAPPANVQNVPALYFYYSSLLRLTSVLTRDDEEQIEQMYRIACLTVFAHNQDDHSKNFSFLYEGNCWCLAPAYDLTYSTTAYGEHTTSIHYNGRDPGVDDLVFIAKQNGMGRKKARDIAESIRTEMLHSLARYLSSAQKKGGEPSKEQVDLDSYAHRTERGQHADEYVRDMRDHDRF